NTPDQYNNGAVDPEGDCLVSEVINPKTAGTCADNPSNVPFSPQAPWPTIGFPNNPIQTNNTFVLDPATGTISFTPPVAGPETLSIRTNEYRNGVKIGSILRDVQIQVITPCTVIPPSSPQIDLNITGAELVNGQIHGCINQPLSFNFDIT